MTQEGLKEGRLRERGLRFKTALGQLTHIETQEANDDETIDFTEVFSDEYDRYVVYVDNVVSATNEDMFIRFSSDGGSTWDSGSSDYAASRFGVEEDGSTNIEGESGNDVIEITNRNLGDDVGENDTGGFKMTISNPANSSRATVLRSSRVSYNHEYGGHIANLGGGIRLTQSAIDSIQFFMEDNNTHSGIFSVYGVDK